MARVPGYTSSGSGFDSLRYQNFWEVVGLERGSVSLVSTIEELLGRISSGSVLEIREYGRRGPLRLPRGTLSPKNLSLTSPTGGSRSICIVRSWTQATELLLLLSSSSSSSSSSSVIINLFRAQFRKSHICITIATAFQMYAYTQTSV
jgi:hypothetical protein